MMKQSKPQAHCNPLPNPPREGEGILPALITLLCLTACSNLQPIYQPVPVDIPITLPCKTPPLQKPEPVLENLTPETPLFDKVKATLIELTDRKAYEAELEAALAACR